MFFLYRVINKFEKSFFSSIIIFYCKIKYYYSGVKIEKDAVLYGLPIITLKKGSLIHIGKRVVLCSKSKYTSLGVNHPIILRTLKNDSKIVIGNDTGMSGGTICAMISVTIGKRTMLGANVTITDTDFHPISPNNRRYNNNSDDIKSREVKIGDDVFIGTNSIILKGVTIGNNSVIGAGSIVVSDIPGNVIAAGNPCNVIRPL